MKVEFDDIVYNPLGGAAYIFKDNLIKYIHDKLKKKKVIISVGAQPNSSPHFGTMSVFCLAFAFAKKLSESYKDLQVSILFEVVDSAPSEQKIINDIKYQKSLKCTGVLDQYMPQFKEILEYNKSLTGIDYTIRYQSEFNNQKIIPTYIKEIIKHKNEISKLLDPDTNRLRIRSSCPKCGLADKNSVNNSYNNNSISFMCPHHGEYLVSINKESYKFEYNTPLRNLLRAMVYGNINNDDGYDYEIIRVTGSDYAGFYQEELLYKVAGILDYKVENLPVIIYCPLITDWSGAKLSKTLYVKHGAYANLPKYLINYEYLKQEKGMEGIKKIYDICSEWVEEPYKLFRNYSIYYFMCKFENKEIEYGDHK